MSDEPAAAPGVSLPDLGGVAGLRLPLVTWGESVELCEMDWDGKVVWSFMDWPEPAGATTPAYQHHDYEREGNPVGYYAPGQSYLRLAGQDRLAVVLSGSLRRTGIRSVRS